MKILFVRIHRENIMGENSPMKILCVSIHRGNIVGESSP